MKMGIISMGLASGLGGVIVMATLAVADEASEAGAVIASAIERLEGSPIAWSLIVLAFAVNFRAPLIELATGLVRIAVARLALVEDSIEARLAEREHKRLVGELDKIHPKKKERLHGPAN